MSNRQPTPSHQSDTLISRPICWTRCPPPQQQQVASQCTLIPLDRKQHQDPTGYTHNDASTPSRQAQQQQSSPASGSKLNYGDKFKIEMVDGDKVTTEIRTMSALRMRAGPDFHQFSQAHARLQRSSSSSSSDRKTNHICPRQLLVMTFRRRSLRPTGRSVELLEAPGATVSR